MSALNYRSLHNQQGQMLLFVTVLFILFLILGATLIDIGMMYNAQTELKAATDAAALAAALELDNRSRIEATVQNYLELNPVQNTTAINAQITLGSWNDKTQSFDASMTDPPTAVKVIADFTGNYFFLDL